MAPHLPLISWIGLALSVIAYCVYTFRQRRFSREGIRVGLKLLLRGAAHINSLGPGARIEYLKSQMNRSDYVMRMVDGRMGSKYFRPAFSDRVSMGDFILRLDQFSMELTFACKDSGALKSDWARLQAEWGLIDDFLSRPYMPFRHVSLSR